MVFRIARISETSASCTAQDAYPCSGVAQSSTHGTAGYQSAQQALRVHTVGAAAGRAEHAVRRENGTAPKSPPRFELCGAPRVPQGYRGTRGVGLGQLTHRRRLGLALVDADAVGGAEPVHEHIHQDLRVAEREQPLA